MTDYVYPHQIIPPNPRLQLVDPKTGMLTPPGLQFLRQIIGFIASTNQIVPCSATNVGNVYTLAIFPSPPTSQIDEYVDYMLFQFIAPATSTGTITAGVDPLSTLAVYKSNGATVASTGDLVADSLYFLIYNSNLDSGAGGFVLK